jgi:1-acyl-sn-glycerol-3-phosphate acyltransferase
MTQKVGLFKQTLKFTAVISLILIYVIHAYIYSFIFRDLWTFRKRVVFLLQRYCKRFLCILAVRAVKQGFTQKNPLFIVSNHMSYLDVLVLSSEFPTTFVTSVEIREVPVLGLLTQLGGCLYVERRNKQNLSQEISELTTAIQKNLTVTVFPEATSTSGEGVLRFRKPLFRAAIDATTAVNPICLNYAKINGEKFNVSNRDLVCWYGDMSFVPHLWKLAGCKEVIAEISLMPEIPYEKSKDHAVLAEESYVAVSSHFRPANSPDIS